jgi:hypothetical protein
MELPGLSTATEASLMTLMPPAAAPLAYCVGDFSDDSLAESQQPSRNAKI